MRLLQKGPLFLCRWTPTGVRRQAFDQPLDAPPGDPHSQFGEPTCHHAVAVPLCVPLPRWFYAFKISRRDSTRSIKGRMPSSLEMASDSFGRDMAFSRSPGSLRWSRVSAYKKAQEALQQHEDMTFSDAEIDAFLPKELRKEADHPK